MPCDLADSLYNTIEYGRVEEERTPRQFPAQPSGPAHTWTGLSSFPERLS